MNGATPSKLKPALIAGVACGVASSIPFVNCINFCCCALVIGGGFLAVFLYFKESPPPAEAPYGDGAVLGLLTGVFGAITATVIGIPIRLVMTQIGLQPDPAQLEEAFKNLEGVDVPPQVLEFIKSFVAGGGLGVVAILIGLITSLIIYSIFALIGGIIGVAVLHKKQAGAAAPPPPAPAV